MGDAMPEVKPSTTSIRKAPNAIIILSVTAFFAVMLFSIITTYRVFNC